MSTEATDADKLDLATSVNDAFRTRRPRRALATAGEEGFRSMSAWMRGRPDPEPDPEPTDEPEDPTR